MREEKQIGKQRKTDKDEELEALAINFAEDLKKIREEETSWG